MRTLQLIKNGVYHYADVFETPSEQKVVDAFDGTVIYKEKEKTKVVRSLCGECMPGPSHDILLNDSRVSTTNLVTCKRCLKKMYPNSNLKMYAIKHTTSGLYIKDEKVFSYAVGHYKKCLHFVESLMEASTFRRKENAEKMTKMPMYKKEHGTRFFTKVEYDNLPWEERLRCKKTMVRDTSLKVVPVKIVEST